MDHLNDPWFLLVDYGGLFAETLIRMIFRWYSDEPRVVSCQLSCHPGRYQICTQPARPDHYSDNEPVEGGKIGPTWSNLQPMWVKTWQCCEHPKLSLSNVRIRTLFSRSVGKLSKSRSKIAYRIIDVEWCWMILEGFFKIFVYIEMYQCVEYPNSPLNWFVSPLICRLNRRSQRQSRRRAWWRFRIVEACWDKQWGSMV